MASHITQTLMMSDIYGVHTNSKNIVTVQNNRSMDQSKVMDQTYGRDQIQIRFLTAYSTQQSLYRCQTKIKI